MGNKHNSPSTRWPEERRQFVKDFLEKSDNPKIIRFDLVKFPEEDPVELVVKDLENNIELTMKSYRYPHEGEQFNGVVFFLHGFTDYSGRCAYIGEKIAKQGYDFYAMDHRGHGKSGGNTLYLPSIDIVSEDNIEFQIKVMNKFYPGEEKPPVFLLTNSMGGMIALNILMRKNESRLQPIKYKSMCLTVPFFGFFNDKLMSRLKPILQLMKKTRGDNILTSEIKVSDDKVPEHLYHWRWDFDNPLHKRMFPVRTILEFHKEVDKHKHQISLQDESDYWKIGVPIQIITCSNDVIVNNEQTQKVFQLLPEPKNLINIEDADHMGLQDGTKIDYIIEESIKWYKKC